MAARTWSNVRPKAKGLPEEGRVYQVGVSPFDAGTAYITLDYHEFGDDTPYVFMTRDYGASWTSIAHGLPSYAAHVVREDPAQKGFLLLGTDNGLWYSRDAGATWKSMTSAFPTSPVFDIQFIKNTRSVAIATHGRGLFVIDDIAPLQSLTPDVASSKFHVFDVAPAALWHSNEYGGSPASAYHAPGVDRAARIQYWLSRKIEATAAQKARHEGPVRIVILDGQNDTVYTANGAGKAGMNTFEWRLGYRGPTKLAIAPPQPGDGDDGAPGPDVLPGTYTAVVMADSQTVRRTIDVRADPHSAFDVAAAREQLTTALAMRDQISMANGVLNGLHSLRRQLSDVDSTAIALAPNGIPADTTVMHAAHQAGREGESADGHVVQSEPATRSARGRYPLFAELLRPARRDGVRRPVRVRSGAERSGKGGADDSEDAVGVVQGQVRCAGEDGCAGVQRGGGEGRGSGREAVVPGGVAQKAYTIDWERMPAAQDLAAGRFSFVAQST